MPSPFKMPQNFRLDLYPLCHSLWFLSQENIAKITCPLELPVAFPFICSVFLMSEVAKLGEQPGVISCPWHLFAPV